MLAGENKRRRQTELNLYLYIFIFFWGGRGRGRTEGENGRNPIRFRYRLCVFILHLILSERAEWAIEAVERAQVMILMLNSQRAITPNNFFHFPFFPSRVRSPPSTFFLRSSCIGRAKKCLSRPLPDAREPGTVVVLRMWATAHSVESAPLSFAKGS